MMNIDQDDRNPRLGSSIASFVKNPSVLFGLVLLISTISKLAALNSRELWLNETYSAFVANLPFAKILRYAAGDVHPPLFYLLLHSWIQIVGDAQAQLRLFSVVLNFFSALAMFVLARRMLGARFGAYAAILFVLSPMLFVFSLEVRMYALFILLFACLLMVHWLVAVEQREDRWLVVAYGVLAALLFYVQYIGIFIILGVFIHWLIASAFPRRRFIRLFAAGLLTILLVSPGVPVLLHQYAGKTQLTRALTLSRQNPGALTFGAPAQNPAEPGGIKVMVKNAAAMLGFYPAASTPLLLLCAIPLVLSLAYAGFLGVIKSDEICRLFCLITLALGVGMFTLHLASTRYMLALIPLLVIAIARAVQVGAAKPRGRVPVIAVATLVLCLYAAGFFRQAVKQHGRPWVNLVGAVQQNYRPGDKVIFDALYAQMSFDYFARHMHFQPEEDGFPLSVYDWWEKQEFKGLGGPVILNSDLDEYVSRLSASRPKAVWLVLNETYYYDPHDALLARLSQLGQVTEIRLPPDPDTPDAQVSPPLRLIRIAIN
jgi:4-amino-4-deoxy-L-arabinose transferase-like glycosyltransferase